MKILRFVSAFVILVALGFIGYRYFSWTDSGQTTSKKGTLIDHSPIVIHPSEYNKDDLNFLNSIRKSAGEIKQVSQKLESNVDEAQDNDEIDEATDSMKEAKKEILFHWNMMHNGYAPQDAGLQKLKKRYEDILENYRIGLASEIEGMENSDIQEMKDGYQLTNAANKDLQEMMQAMK